MSKQTEALKLALEALEGLEALLLSMGLTHLIVYGDAEKAITNLQKELEDQPAQQTIHCKHRHENNGVCPHHNLHCGWPKCNEPEQPAQQEPVAWIEHEWSGTGLKHLHLERRDPILRDEVVNPVWTPLYTSPPAQRKPLTDEQKDAARWRFLVDNSFDKDGITQFHVWEHSWEPHSQTGEPAEWKQRVRGPALDHFIDRAIEAAHGIKENT